MRRRTQEPQHGQELAALRASDVTVVSAMVIAIAVVLSTMACGGERRPAMDQLARANIDRVTTAYASYADGDCDAVRSGIQSHQVRGWQPSEARVAYQLLEGFCAELDADFDLARRIYRTILREAPLSFAADDASERLRVLRQSDVEADYTQILEAARANARSGSTARTAVRREPVSYPPLAHRAGISGHAVVEFKVTAEGMTETPIVVDSSPPLIFDGAAIRAIRSWRYSTDSGNAEIERQAIRLVFRPEDSTPAPMAPPNSISGDTGTTTAPQ